MTDRVVVAGRPFIIRAAVSEVGSQQQLRQLRSELCALSLTVLILGGLGGVAIARRATGPLGRLAERARRITADHIHERIPEEPASAEIEDLRTAFNETLGPSRAVLRAVAPLFRRCLTRVAHASDCAAKRGRGQSAS